MMPSHLTLNGKHLRLCSAIYAIALLAACGGGSGTQSTPRPMPTPTPTPTPTPIPTPSPTPTPSSFDTQEYRESDGPVFHNAITAWEAGITGQGSIIAVIDTGIDSDSPEFAGRIHPNSTDIAGNRGIDGIDDHGTNVAMVAAAARDDTGILGIAFDAQVLAIRADEPGSCTADSPQDPSLGCFFNDVDITAGVDLAIASGARVINLSLGGESASQILLDAVARASAAGIVVVVSAGNAGDGSDPSIDPNQPEPFATSLVQAGGDNVIIAGSIDANGQISGFSNRAGNSFASYLAARGEAICCVYQDGELFIETIGGQQFVTLFSGTSFSAPQIAGAVALLAQAFPNLTGAEIVEILLDSALDAGASGDDVVYGRGILDIAAALAPAGSTSIAGGQTALGLADRVVIASPAMGDALGGQTLATIITDKYDRAYGFDLAGGFSGSSIVPRLRGAVEHSGRVFATEAGGVALAFTVADAGPVDGSRPAKPLQLTSEQADQARVLAARSAARIAPGTEIAVGYAQGTEGLVAHLQGRESTAFLIAPDTRGDTGFFQSVDASLALRQSVGPWGVTFHAQRSNARLGYGQRAEERLYQQVDSHPTTSIGVAVDREFGALAATLGMSWLKEDSTILGGQFHPSIAAGGADTYFLDTAARWNFGKDWALGGAWRWGATRPDGGEVLLSSSRFESQAWSFDLERQNLFVTGDSLGFRISQPLRVTSGGLKLYLPDSYDYATETAGYSVRHLSLAPRGRELIGELAWRGPVMRGRGGASLFYRQDPGHFSDAPADIGAVVSFSAEF